MAAAEKAEKALQKAMPGLFGLARADPVRLQAAIEEARRCGVSADAIAKGDAVLKKMSEEKGAATAAQGRAPHLPGRGSVALCS